MCASDSCPVSPDQVPVSLQRTALCERRGKVDSGAQVFVEARRLTVSEVG